jgi:hypothetical protein
MLLIRDSPSKNIVRMMKDQLNHPHTKIRFCCNCGGNNNKNHIIKLQNTYYYCTIISTGRPYMSHVIDDAHLMTTDEPS